MLLASRDIEDCAVCPYQSPMPAVVAAFNPDPLPEVSLVSVNFDSIMGTVNADIQHGLNANARNHRSICHCGLICRFFSTARQSSHHVRDVVSRPDQAQIVQL